MLGEIQHGHMDEVGYDTYCKLLDEVVKEAKGIKVEEEPEVTIDIDVSRYIPDTYIENTAKKWKAIETLLLQNRGRYKNIAEDLTDRFGKMPDEVNNLIEIAKLKELCKNMVYNKGCSQRKII